VIFVSVGTQLPFDRLVRVVDQWAVSAGRTDVIAQVGHSSYVPSAIDARPFMSPDEFVRIQRSASLLVAHCGIGSMLSALEIGQPVLMMPRRHSLREHRNDHQIATARHLRTIPGVYIADNERELVESLNRPDALFGAAPISVKAPTRFTGALQSILEELTG